MKRLRLALLTSRYWPMWSEGGSQIATLAEELQKFGHAVQVVTRSWESHWPSEIQVRQVPVIRLAFPQVRWWGTMRYMHSLLNWLDHSASELDGVIVSGLGYEAWCACRVLPQRNVPVVLRADLEETQTDLRWYERALFGSRVRQSWEQSRAIVAPTTEAQQWLRQEFSRPEICLIPNGTFLPSSERATFLSERQSILTSLREANHDLVLPERSPLVVSIGGLDEHSGYDDLAIAWQKIIAHWPLARLWIVGDGPKRDVLWEQIKDLDLRYRLCLPGSFEAIDDLLAVADLFVAPARRGGGTFALLRALAAGVPIVATDIPSHREIIGSAGKLVCGEPMELAAGIRQVLENKMLAAAFGEAGRERVQASFSGGQMAEKHLALLGSE